MIQDWPCEASQELLFRPEGDDPEFLAVALPSPAGKGEELEMEGYLGLLADRVAWLLRREKWDLKEAARLAERLLLDQGGLQGLDEATTPEHWGFRLVDSPALRAKLGVALGAFPQPLNLESDPGAAEDFRLLNLEAWLERAQV